MDIVNFITDQGHASLLTKLMIKPHQYKLISHLKTTNKDSQKILEALPMEEAVRQLDNRSTDPEVIEIEDKINQALKTTIDYQELGSKGRETNKSRARESKEIKNPRNQLAI